MRAPPGSLYLPTSLIVEARLVVARCALDGQPVVEDTAGAAAGEVEGGQVRVGRHGRQLRTLFAWGPMPSHWTQATSPPQVFQDGWRLLACRHLLPAPSLLTCVLMIALSQQPKPAGERLLLRKLVPPEQLSRLQETAGPAGWFNLEVGAQVVVSQLLWWEMLWTMLCLGCAPWRLVACGEHHHHAPTRTLHVHGMQVGTIEVPPGTFHAVSTVMLNHDTHSWKYGLVWDNVELRPVGRPGAGGLPLVHTSFTGGAQTPVGCAPGA